MAGQRVISSQPDANFACFLGQFCGRILDSAEESDFNFLLLGFCGQTRRVRRFQFNNFDESQAGYVALDADALLCGYGGRVLVPIEHQHRRPDFFRRCASESAKNGVKCPRKRRAITSSAREAVILRAQTLLEWDSSFGGIERFSIA
jgi:hypothetical protein